MQASTRLPLRSRLERWYADSLQQRGLVFWAFAEEALLFRWVMHRRRKKFLQQPETAVRLPVPVIIVGNIVAGGAGKTPIVIALVQALQQQGYRPGVLARGYQPKGRTRNLEALEVSADSPPQTCGDEPVLIQQHTQVPVFVHPNRVMAGQTLLQRHPDTNVLVLDDGLQHYTLARDVELVVFDRRGMGNGRFLPAGPLREATHRPRDATLFVDTAAKPDLCANSPAFEVVMETGALYRLSDPQQTLPISGLSGQEVAAFAGIGDPERFFQTLAGAGAKIEAHPLSDHYEFEVNPFQATQKKIIVITEKDAVKCAKLNEYLNDDRLWVLPVKTPLDPGLMALIVNKLEKIHGS
jgi:tetraacyldisaccharide 4'-kinase